MSLVNVLGKFGSTSVSKSIFTSTPAKYALTVSPNISSVNVGGIDYPAVDEGTTVTFSLVPNKVNKFNSGTVIPYTITGIETADIVDGNLTGQFIVGTDMVRTFTIDEDAHDDSTNEIMTMTLQNPDPTNAVGLSASVYIVDSSKGPPAYTLYLSGNGSTTGFVYEDTGTTVTFALKTRGVYDGTQIPYTITGIDTNDLDVGSASLQGYFTVSSILTAGWLNDRDFPNPLPEDITYVTFKIKRDGIIEGNETMVITLSSHVDPVRGILTTTEGRTAQVIIKDEIITQTPYLSAVRLLLKGDGLNDATNNTFLDSSTNNFAITRNGSVTQGSFSPYPLNGVAYSPTLHGGSGYFNGSSYLTVPANSNFNFSSGIFTVECWVNIDNVSSSPVIASNYLNSNNAWTIRVLGNKFIVCLTGDGVDIQGSTTVIPGTWYHIAVSGSPGLYKLFINGIQEGATYTGATALAGTTLNIGRYSGGLNVVGYISNLRIVNGTNFYSSNFTPSTSPLTNVANTSLLLNFTNGGIIDSTAKNNLVTVGNTKVSTSIKKYGTGSMYFSTFASQLTLPVATAGSKLDYGAGNFTIECWYNLVAVTNLRSGPIISQTVSGNNNLLLAIDSSRAIVLWLGHVNLGASATGVVPLNTWCHIALVRNGNNVKIFVDGTAVHTATTTSTALGTNMVPCINGYAHDTRYGNQCYMDNFKITKGVAVYTATFTPPLT